MAVYGWSETAGLCQAVLETADAPVQQCDPANWPRLKLVWPLESEWSRGIHEASAREEVFDLLDEDVAAHVADGFGERELFGAGLDAVLGEAAFLNATIAG